MDSTEDDQGGKRNHAFLIGYIGGFGIGLVVALLFGTDSGMTAVSGSVLGAAAAFLTQTQHSLWTKAGVALITILAVTYAWWLK
jgi:hypothetical protein